MFVKLAERITQQLENDNVINSEKRELYKYGFQQGFILALNFLTSIAIGIIFGMFFECILLLAAYMPLRSYAGGHHSDSSEKCYIVSSLIMVIWMCLLKFEILPISCCVIMLLISACICFTFAPVESSNKPLDEREQNVYRQKSLIILAVEICLWIFMSLILRKYEAIIPIVLITEAIMLILGKAKNRHDDKIIKNR
ncbi:MAG: accessory gene regulator B family protein [Ruminococcus sp.]|nr:accessory gene regulator B family protein [Ruminococcus sp.]MDE7097840.1 accessory gene regulator B family protein [Ruminococcus sp.]